MGSSQLSNISKNKLFNSTTYAFVDKIIFIAYQFMSDKLKDIPSKITYIDFKQLGKDKSNKVIKGRFFKWHLMGYEAISKYLLTLSPKEIIESMENYNYDGDAILETEISYCEQGLRAYYLKNPAHFESRIIKAPPASFRWLSWMICAGIPINRPSNSYKKLISYILDDANEIQIQKDLTRTLEESHPDLQNIKKKLYRLLKSIALIDPEMAYVQGINFVCAFFLLVSQGNEIETFYFLIALFSMTFSSKFGMRDLYTQSFPLLMVCMRVFDSHLEKKMKELSAHLNKIGMVSEFWVHPWIQMVFVDVFPIEDTIRIWDAYFVYGIPFLISFALAMTDHIQKDLLAINDMDQIMIKLKMFNPRKKNGSEEPARPIIVYNINTLIEKAIKIYPIDIKEIEDKMKKDCPNIKRDKEYDYKQIISYIDDKVNNIEKQKSMSFKKDNENIKDISKKETEIKAEIVNINDIKTLNIQQPMINTTIMNHNRNKSMGQSTVVYEKSLTIIASAKSHKLKKHLQEYYNEYQEDFNNDDEEPIVFQSKHPILKKTKEKTQKELNFNSIINNLVFEDEQDIENSIVNKNIHEKHTLNQKTMMKKKYVL